MELIPINGKKMKAILTEGDLEAFGMVTDDLDYGNPETRRLLKELLGRAKEASGFETYGDRVLVQLYPSRDGGCEIYITRLCSSLSTSESDIYHMDEYNTYEGEEEDILNDNTYINDDTHRILVRFENAEAMIGFCRRLDSLKYKGKSQAYFECGKGNTKFYLFINEIAADKTHTRPMISPIGFAWEYGQIEFSEAKKRAIPERCTRIEMDDAVGSLARL